MGLSQPTAVLKPVAPVRSVTKKEQAHCALSDDELMTLSKAGHQDAFEVLVRRYQTFVYGLAARFLGDSSAGRDVAQDVFLALWAERARFRPLGRFRSYLVSMTLHRCNSLARRQRCHQQRTAVLLSRDEVPPPPPEDVSLERLAARERLREIHGTLSRLSEKQRAVIILRFTHDMHLHDISDALGVPVNTVKSHLSRGLKRLEALLTRGDTP